VVVARPAWVVVDLDDTASGASIEEGDPVRLRCPARLRTMAPVLDAIRLAATRHGATLEAGAAFGWGGRVVIVRGPSGAGKTGVLLRALERGATLVAAESCWVDGEGGVWPLPQPVRVRPHHLGSPVLRSALHPVERLRLAAGRLLPARWSRRAFVDIPAQRLASGRPPAAWMLAGFVHPDGRTADATLDEAERLARS
jgi:hypothetical protein